MKEPSQEKLFDLLGQYQAGRLDEAESLASALVSDFPEHQFGWKVLGAVLKRKGRVEESLVSMRRSAQLMPDDAEAQSNLGVTLLELGRLEEAAKNLVQAVKLRPDFSEAHYNLGATLHQLGKLEDAEAAYEQAIMLEPNYAEAYNNLGNILQGIGKVDKAEASYRHAILLRPDYAEAYRNFALVKKFCSRDEYYLRMEKVYADPQISSEKKCHICFALAKASDDLADYRAAFEYYKEGNALRRELLPYDSKLDTEFFMRLKNSFSALAASSLQRRRPDGNLVPLFIVGMPRSGTTLVEQIISSHSLVTGAGELPFISLFGGALASSLSHVDSAALTSLRAEYLSSLDARSEGSSFVTDKMPLNFRFLGLIVAALPESKIIHVKRDPAAVCWANFEQYFDGDGLKYCYDLQDIVTYHNLYLDLMEYWRELFPHRIYELEYEALTVNQEKETMRLIDHLELNWEPECLSPQDNKRAVATASSEQVRRKIYQGSSERWKRYQPFLDGALDSL